MNYRFVASLFLCGKLLLAQQLPSAMDSLSVVNDQVPDSIYPMDSLPPLAKEKIRDSLGSDRPATPLDSLSAAQDSLKKVALKKKAKKRPPIRRRYIEIDTLALINNYKVFYEDGRVEIIDTTLTVQKDYRFNFLRKDYFELLPLPNVAQGFNRLGYEYLNQPVQPSLGAPINQYGFFESNDIPYFQVPTPLTELFFRTTFEQGELVDALVTVNTSPKLNLMVAYKGLRSLGKYVNSRANGGQFRSSINYTDAEERYRMRAHFVAQTRENQVNGGLTGESIYFFENAPYYQEVDANGEGVVDDNGDPVEVFYDGFLDRSRLSPIIRASSILSGRRFYLGQEYQFKQKPEDSLKQALRFGNRFTYEKRFYEYTKGNVNDDFFGEVSDTIESLEDRSDIKVWTNETYVKTHLPYVGQLKGGFVFNRWNYAHGRSATSTGTNYLGQQVNQLALVANWKREDDKGIIQGNVHYALGDAIATRHAAVEGQRKFFTNWLLTLGTQYRSQPQNFNLYQYQSNYVDLNWDQTDLKNTERLSFYGSINHARWFQLEVQWHRIDNHTYLRNTTRFVDWGTRLDIAPVQSEDRLEYLKMRWYNHLPLGKFSLTNTVQYQRVAQLEADRPAGSLGEPSLLNVPQWTTRNTVAFSSEIFNKALYLQTGFHFQFFTGYFADAIHPVLGEYITQNNERIGEYPRIDFFANAKISQTRVFFKVEHLNNSISGYRYYAAPFIPYRDMSIRFGLVWNFFQ